MSTKEAYSAAEAAEHAGCSEKTIKRAIAATDPATYPPPLDAGRHGRGGKYVIAAEDLRAWINELKRFA